MSDSTPYVVPQEPGRWRAIALATAVHAALFVFLWIGIRWQSETPVAVEAEVWDMQTKEAAPVQPPAPPPMPAPEPAPEAKPAPEPVTKTPPLDSPDIALEQEKKRKEKARLEVEEQLANRKELADKERQAKLKEQADKERQAKLKEQEEKDKLAQLEKQKAEERARKQKELADKKRLQDEKQMAELAEKIRAEDMRKITAGTGGTGSAAKSQGMRGDAGYAAKIAAKIKSNTAFAAPPDLQGNPYVEYDVQLFPDGTLRGPPRKVKSSGIAGFDDAVRRAIELSQPFPADKSGTVPSGFPVRHQLKEQ